MAGEEDVISSVTIPNILKELKVPIPNLVAELEKL